MNKTTIIIILLAVIAVILFMSFSKPKSTNGFTGSLVNAGPQAGKTNAYYAIDPTTTQQTYWLTYTPVGYTVRTQVPETGLPISKEISATAYKAFITKYPTGLAEGNVLAEYN